MPLSTFISTVADNSMKSPDQNYATVLPARQAFLETNGLSADDTTLLHLTYETDDFCRYVTLAGSDKGDGITRPPSIISDALVTTQPSHALLLPLADCIGAVIHDPTRNILMVSHLGRHNLEQDGGNESVQYLIGKHDVNPKNLTVWLSPAAGKENYPLYSFDNRSLHEVAIEQLTNAGVPPENIDASLIDTTTDTNYFSHSQFLKGHRQTDGRFAIVALMN